MSPWEGRTRRIERPPIAEINRLAAGLAAEGRDLINLGQAILALPPPPAALTEVERFLAENEVHGYSPDPGAPDVLDAVAAFLREVKSVPARSEETMLTCGANQAYVNALLAISEPGDEIVLLGPYYFDHLFAVELAACKPVVVPLALAKDRFVLDFDALEKALGPKTRMVTLVSPANPAGMVVPEEDVGRLCRLCNEKGIWLVSDETYDLLTFPPHRHTSPAALGLHDRVIVLGSFSKTFALASWRVGYLWGPGVLADEVVKVQDALVVCAPVPSQWAVRGALSDVEGFRSRTMQELTGRRDALLEAIARSRSLEPIPPEGATFVLARIRDGRSSFEFSKTLLREAGILSVPGAAFGPQGEGYVRLSFGNQPADRIREAGERLVREEWGKE